jgi:hypothetical protein
VVCPVPEAKYPRVAFVPQHRNAGRVEGQHPTVIWRQSKPSGRDNSKDVAVGHQGNVANNVVGAFENIICALTGLVQRFAIDVGMSPNRPAGNGFTDLDRGQAFIVAVVDFDEIVVDGRDRKSGQRRRIRRSGLTKQAAKVRSRSISPEDCAWARPLSVRATSVRPVCFRDLLHSVSP